MKPIYSSIFSVDSSICAHPTNHQCSEHKIGAAQMKLSFSECHHARNENNFSDGEYHDNATLRKGSIYRAK
jgi:hypothetical protein